MSTTISVAENAVRDQTLQWLALTLTPGLGPTRARHLVQHMGCIAAVFRATLTELEATGLLAVSAQALGDRQIAGTRAGRNRARGKFRSSASVPR